MADGGLSDVWAVCPDVSDAGEAYELDGGTWVLPPPRGPRLACRLAGCEAYAAQLETPVPLLSPETAMVLAFSLLVGLAAGFVLDHWVWR